MKAVMYGGGNIGRGFVGMLLSASGYHVTFVDVAQPVVQALNTRHSYPVRIISDRGHEDVTVDNVSAVDGNDTQAVAEAIAQADIMATAVGVNVLKFIIANLVAGIRLRMERSGKPLNIVICENLMDANKVLAQMLKEQLTPQEQAWFDENVGLVEASIGRMVPVQTEQMKDGDPLRVCVERYGYLPVDKAAFKGDIPQIRNLVPYTPFGYYLKRKLYVHNMGHATCAYLGDMLGLTYIYQAVENGQVYGIVKNAMQESALALSKMYSVPLEEILYHIDDLLFRFTNSALMDTCQRVGGDPRRKLSPQDRLIGAAQLAREMGVSTAYISVGAAAGLRRYLAETEGMTQSMEDATATLQSLCGLEKDSPLAKQILGMYEKILSGCDLLLLRQAAEQQRAEANSNVV